MTIDAATLSILTAVGSTGIAVGGGLWTYVKLLHSNVLKGHNEQIDHLLKRSEDCEEDRRTLHGRINNQSERITEISMKLGRMQGQIDHNHIANANPPNPGN